MPPPPAAIQTFEDFARVHAVLLAASGLPPQLHRQLFRKLSFETFDAGAYFAVDPCEGGRQRRLVLSAECMAKGSSVFLIDHAWSFRLPDALKQLKEIPGLAERMAALMCVDVDESRGSVDGEEGEEGVSEGNGGARSRGSVMEIVESEAEKLRERGSGAAVWLELEELGIDDETLCSMELSRRFPVHYRSLLFC